jgi:hypothetical protein
MSHRVTPLRQLTSTAALAAAAEAARRKTLRLPPLPPRDRSGRSGGSSAATGDKRSRRKKGAAVPAGTHPYLLQGAPRPPPRRDAAERPTGRSGAPAVVNPAEHKAQSGRSAAHKAQAKAKAAIVFGDPRAAERLRVAEVAAYRREVSTVALYDKLAQQDAKHRRFQKMQKYTCWRLCCFRRRPAVDRCALSEAAQHAACLRRLTDRDLRMMAEGFAAYDVDHSGT